MSYGEVMTAPLYEVKPPAEVLAEDVICQSFIQSSSTLAYACLLIRRGGHDLAAHVLQGLEQKPTSRFKDMVFYLQAQIAVETGDFAAVKKRLAARAHQHPGDMVALGLLASAVFLEWEGWQRRNPAEASLAGAMERTLADDGPLSGPGPGPAMPSYHTLPVPTVPSPHAALSGPGPAASGVLPLAEALAAAARSQAAGSAASRSDAPPFPDQPYLPYAEGDFGIYQALVTDGNTLALSLWNQATRKLRTACKQPGLETLVTALPEALPSGIAESVRSLDGGAILKVCFSFQALTVTSLHAGSENLALVTGNMARSLLTMVRAENIFLKGTQGATARAGAAP